MLVSERQRFWLEQRRSGLPHPVMQFVEDRLELGAGTILARMAGNPGQSFGLDLDGRETRIMALLAAAYRRPISPGVLENLRSAGREWARGEACLAQIHLALTGLPRLSDPEDAAYRVFMAEGLLDDGVAPRNILRALDLDPAPLDRLDKAYYDTEPRVPQGSGRPSGRWTDGSASAATGETIPVAAVGATVALASGGLADAGGSFLSRSLSTAALAALSEFASGVAAGALGAVATLGLLVIPTPGRSSVSKGDVPGRADLSYHWDAEAGRLVLSIKIASVKIPVVDAHVGLDGVYYDRNDTPIARVLDGRLIIETRALPRPSVVPESLWSEGHDDADSAERDSILPLALDTTRNDPRLCPDPGPDIPHGASERAKVYQEQITGLPRGLAVRLNGVVFDGCREEDGTLLEAKGWGYAAFISKDGDWYSWYRHKEQLDWQLVRQSIAAGDRRVEWHVAEKKAADLIASRVRALELRNIVVIWDPQDGPPRRLRKQLGRYLSFRFFPGRFADELRYYVPNRQGWGREIFRQESVPRNISTPRDLVSPPVGKGCVP